MQEAPQQAPEGEFEFLKKSLEESDMVQGAAEEIHPDVVRIADPELQKLAQHLPIMRDGKPRRFARFMECYEWTFTRLQHSARERNMVYDGTEHLSEATQRWAEALWAYFGTKEKPS